MYEKNNKFIYNYGFDKELVENAKEKLSKIKEVGYFEGKNNANIYYEKYSIDNEKGRVVISHGFSECIDKFTEMIYYFTEMGYSVYAIEHRGHGRSGSLSKTHKNQINVEKFKYYVDDLKTFLDKIVVEKDTDLYLYAHSMGGAIGTMFLEEYNGYFKKAILSAPMMEIKTGDFPKWIAYIISSLYILAGKGDKYLFGQGPFDGKYDLEGAGTSNKYRYENHLEELKNNEYIQRSGGTFKWMFESLKASDKIIKKKNVQKINVPILLFQSGRDTFVKDRGQNKFCERAKNCKKVRFENAKHEVFGEDDETLMKYLKIIKEFLD
ncbi:alpha/beta fold hydrolase [Clostridium baratii]|uniref:alpha/beta fold hydrolase n=1 Tax=Clostridium baratii TaxID=1561 RepID=UPI001C02D07A|nr:alpha/beta hydrolase [Clostridium baratii]MBT9831957.1 alpha/beta fold hydrolase [Clostridium baratii]